MIADKPTLLDIDQMQSIVKEDILNGNILFRSDDEIATNIRSYTVIREDKNILGYGALHIHTKTLAEIRSLVVDKNFRGKGIGAKIVKELVKEAKDLKLSQVFTLTYKKEFFEKLDFKEIPKESLPEQKIWADCIKCQHFPVCNEVSLIINL
jgi:amino-acid N-acetyltransferase